MIVVLAKSTDDAAAQGVLARMDELGLRGRLLHVGARRLIHVTSGRTARARRLLTLEEVQALLPTSGPRVRSEGRRFYPYHTLRMGSALFVLLGLLVLLSGFRPPPPGTPHVAGAVLPAPDWPWYLAPLRGLLRLAPDHPAWVGPGAALVVLGLVLALPFLDRAHGTGSPARGPALYAGLLLGALLLGLGLWEVTR